MASTSCAPSHVHPSMAALSTLVVVGTAAVIVAADRWLGLAKLI